MNIKVVYHSKSGNTEKVAEAIAVELNVTATPVAEAQSLLAEQIDLLFFGDGMYFGGMFNLFSVKIQDELFALLGNTAVFSTSGGSWPMGPAGIQEQLKKQGIQVLSESFKCHGAAFGVGFPSHPDEKDLNDARLFARTMAETVK